MRCTLSLLLATWAAPSESARRYVKHHERDRRLLRVTPEQEEFPPEPPSGVHPMELPADSGAPFTAKLFPMNEQQRDFPGDHGQIRTGLAISGGGSRALSWTMGVYRALEHLGLMSKVDAVSSVSGGGWASSIYMFQRRDPIYTLLGNKTDFSSLTLEQLEQRMGTMNDVVCDSTNLRFAWYAARYWNNEVWERMVSETILKPFDLGDRFKYMAQNETHRADIIRRNPQLRESDFYVPVSGRPKTFIMNGIIASPKDYPSDLFHSVPLQMSSDWIGTPSRPNGTSGVYYKSDSFIRSDKQLVMGGGFIESFAFGGQEPSQQHANGLTQVTKPNYALSLASAVAISSGPLFRPQRWYWPIMPDGEQKQEPVNFEFADGGMLENSGVLALLARQVKRIVMVLSTSVPLDDAFDFCDAASQSDWDKVFSNNCEHAPCTLTSMFGYALGDGNARPDLTNYDRNQVFEKAAGLPFLCKLQTLKKAGKPTVASETFRVIDNEWFGIKGGFDVKMVVMPIELSTDFISSLPDSMQKELKENSVFERYPFFDLFEHLDTIQLKRPLSNLMAATAEYFVMENKELFADVLQ